MSIDSFEILQGSQVDTYIGWSRSKRYAQIKEGLFFNSFPLAGGKINGWLKRHVEIYCAARAAGATDDEIKELVKKLDTARENIDWRGMVAGGIQHGRD